jgi:hypothetical protein
VFGAKFCSAGDKDVVVVGEVHEGSLGVALQSTDGARKAVVDGQEPSDAGAEPLGHVCGDVDVLSIVAGGELPLLPVDSGDVAGPPLLLPLPPLLLPLPPLLLSPLPSVVVLTLVLSPLLLSPPPLPLLLLCFFANAKFTLLLPVTKVIVDIEDTSVRTRNTKIIFLTN